MSNLNEQRTTNNGHFSGKTFSDDFDSGTADGPATMFTCAEAQRGRDAMDAKLLFGVIIISSSEPCHANCEFNIPERFTIRGSDSNIAHPVARLLGRLSPGLKLFSVLGGECPFLF